MGTVDCPTRLVLQSRLSSRLPFPVVVPTGVRLVLSPPACAVQDVAGVGDACPGQAGYEVSDLGQGELYEAFLPRSGAPFWP